MSASGFLARLVPIEKECLPVQSVSFQRDLDMSYQISPYTRAATVSMVLIYMNVSFFNLGYYIFNQFSSPNSGKSYHVLNSNYRIGANDTIYLIRFTELGGILYYIFKSFFRKRQTSKHASPPIRCFRF